MKRCWTDDELEYLIKDIKQTEEINEYSWWILFGALILMEVIVIEKIVSLF